MPKRLTPERLEEARRHFNDRDYNWGVYFLRMTVGELLDHIAALDHDKECLTGAARINLDALYDIHKHTNKVVKEASQKGSAALAQGWEPKGENND